MKEDLKLAIGFRFADHVGVPEREGLLAELEEIGASRQGNDENWIELRVTRPAKWRFVTQLLRDEENAGRIFLKAD